MITVRTFGKEYHYFLKQESHLPEKERTKFVYKTPPLEKILESQDEARLEQVGEELVYKIDLDKKAKAELVRAALVRIENLPNDTGDMVAWPSDVKGQDEVLACLAPYILELAAAFELAVVPSKEEVKNSK